MGIHNASCIPGCQMTGDEDKPYAVSELTAHIRELLEGSIGQVWIAGEISNFRQQSSGHCYFTLKDERAQLSAVLFKGAAALVPFRISDGQQVILFGDITVYEAQGKYQVIVRKMIGAGQGDLHRRFEELKRKLSAEGLFDAERKKPLPLIPESVVILTSPTGAAIQDMMNVLARRAPQLRVYVYPVRVQGAEAPAEIAAAIETLTNWHDEDVFHFDALIVARGGGSLEDLWAFNEEAVARALAAVPFPTISGVGHEIDFTIADFVADLRAPTPSAAAELLIPDATELRETVESQCSRLAREVDNRLEHLRLHLRRLGESVVFREPARVVEAFQQRLDDWIERLDLAPERAFISKRQNLALLTSQFQEKHPQHRIELLASRLHGLGERLELLNPQKTLERGYAILRDETGSVIRSITQLRPQSRFIARLADGDVNAEASS